MPEIASPQVGPYRKTHPIAKTLTIAVSGVPLAVLLMAGVARGQTNTAEITVSNLPYFSGPVFHTQRNQVDVRVVVRDKHGNPVGGLHKDDFLVYDNGKLQDISDFSVDYAAGKAVPGSSNPPASPVGNTSASIQPTAAPSRFIVLFFDDRDKPVSDLVYAREAAEKFVTESLGPADHVGIFTASGESELSFTDDTHTLTATLESLLPHMKTPSPMSGACPRESVYEAYLIAEVNDANALAQAAALAQGCCYECQSRLPRVQKENLEDAARRQARETLDLAQQFSLSIMGSLDRAIESLAPMPGSHILVFTSPGFLTTTLEPQQQHLVNEALRANVVINSLDPKGLEAEAPGGDISQPHSLVDPSNAHSLGSFKANTEGNNNAAGGWHNTELDELDDVLAELARGTGGQFFRNDNDLGEGLRQMAAAPQVSYALGFSPVDLKADGRLHRLDVKLTEGRPYTLESRRAYIAPTKSSEEDQATREKIDREVLATDDIQNLPVVVTSQADRADTGGVGLGVSVHIDLWELPFPINNGRHTEKLTFVTALINGDGKLVSGRLGVIDMALKSKTLRTLSKGGVTAHVVLPAAPPGVYQLREVVEESADNKMFASSQTVIFR